ncbi:hypothetical protein LRS13_05255 [Svornostia abyssi]|uniref:Lamin tail domain-containing protein n=1 Tax=Svornostia abyssi TaxID=2898438 RepID=A0ABY5PJS9_9ACTN|nr:hypothetical protein LRS13_05255 [Parviterribacteraceae bacterium J379]
MFRTCLTATIAAALLAPAAADAEVVVKGTGEPAFTNSANNTQWVEWSNNGPYRVEFNHHVNGGTAVVDGPYNVASTGSTSVNWSGIRGVSVPLAEGSTYMICGFGRWYDGVGMWFPDFSTACGDADRRGLRASTTIDRTAPTIGVALARRRARDAQRDHPAADQLRRQPGGAVPGELPVRAVRRTQRRAVRCRPGVSLHRAAELLPARLAPGAPRRSTATSRPGAGRHPRPTARSTSA